jgi:hypothetical protein
MTLLVETQPIPLTLGADGVIRVGGTRITLDTVIYAFLDRASAEEIAQQYPYWIFTLFWVITSSKEQYWINTYSKEKNLQRR